MSYENAAATKLMATHCGICGRSLVDAVSVERGVGPECWSHVGDGSELVSAEVRDAANKLVYKAAILANNGEISRVLEMAEEIRGLGLPKLADKVGKRFRNSDRYAEIVLTVEGDSYRVETPFRRGAKKEFVEAWRAIPGRRFRDKANYVPAAQKTALFGLLRRFFGGKVAKGPKGVFRIPEPEFGQEQGELAL